MSEINAKGLRSTLHSPEEKFERENKLVKKYIIQLGL